MRYPTTKKRDHRTRLTAGGNLIYYPGEVSTPTTDFITIKIHINSAIPYVKSRDMCMDINNFYLNKQMDREKYIMIQISMIPKEFVENIISQKKHTMDTFMHG